MGEGGPDPKSPSKVHTLFVTLMKIQIYNYKNASKNEVYLFEQFLKGDIVVNYLYIFENLILFMRPCLHPYHL